MKVDVVHVRPLYESRRYENVTQRKLFLQEVAPLVNRLLEGRNATVIACGAKETGKTFTEDNENVDVISRSIKRLFRVVEEHKYKCRVAVTYVETDGDKVQDLLTQETKDDLTEVRIKNAVEFNELYEQGRDARKLAVKDAKETLKPVHSVITVHVCTREDVSGEINNSKFHFIELAGDGNSRLELENGGESATSLLVLENLISSLNSTEGSRNSCNRTLARILQDSLSGNSHVVLFCNVSPSVHTFRSDGKGAVTTVKNASGIAGDCDNMGLTMEEKLRRWKLAKQKKQRIPQNHGNSIVNSKRDSAGFKRKRGDVDCIGTTAVINSETLCTNLSTPKETRRPVLSSHKFVTSSSSKVAKEKRVPVLSEDALMVSPVVGSAKHPIIIEDLRETTASVRQDLQVAILPTRKGCPSSTGNVQGKPCSPIIPNTSFIAKQNSSSISSVDAQVTLDLGQPELSPSKNLPPVHKQNDRDMPIAKCPEAITTEETNTHTAKPKTVCGGNPALDKENLAMVSVVLSPNMPVQVVTVEKKPELLAKDLIQVAITFEKKRRITTAYSIFKRASHILPKKSAKLIERLERLGSEHPRVADQVPSQDLSTAAFMAKVLERDLMSVLNHGDAKELTELHTIGGKRAEVVLDKRPFQQLQELQRVPGISSNLITKLYEYHTNWENHVRRTI